MKRGIFRFAAITFLAVSVLFFSGCPEEGEEEIETALVGNWSNEKPGAELKTFSIKSDGSFTATLADPEISSVPGTVNGVLIKEGSDYMMNNMKETTGISWGGAVGTYNGAYVQITLSNYDLTFDLKCKDVNIVERFFGGTYYRQ